MREAGDKGEKKGGGERRGAEKEAGLSFSSW